MRLGAGGEARARPVDERVPGLDARIAVPVERAPCRQWKGPHLRDRTGTRRSVWPAKGDFADRGCLKRRNVALPDIEIEQVGTRHEPFARTAVCLVGIRASRLQLAQHSIDVVATRLDRKVDGRQRDVGGFQRADTDTKRLPAVTDHPARLTGKDR